MILSITTSLRCGRSAQKTKFQGRLRYIYGVSLFPNKQRRVKPVPWLENISGAWAHPTAARNRFVDHWPDRNDFCGNRLITIGPDCRIRRKIHQWLRWIPVVYCVRRKRPCRSWRLAKNDHVATLFLLNFKSQTNNLTDELNWCKSFQTGSSSSENCELLEP